MQINDYMSKVEMRIGYFFYSELVVFPSHKHQVLCKGAGEPLFPCSYLLGALQFDQAFFSLMLPNSCAHL